MSTLFTFLPWGGVWGVFSIMPTMAPALLAHLVIALGELHAAALSASAGMDLGLHHPELGTGLGGEALGGVDGLIGVVGHDAALNGDTELLEDLLALVLVKVHVR